MGRTIAGGADIEAVHAFVSGKLRKSKREECETARRSLSLASANACFRSADIAMDARLSEYAFGLWMDCLKLPASCEAALCA